MAFDQLYFVEKDGSTYRARDTDGVEQWSGIDLVADVLDEIATAHPAGGFSIMFGADDFTLETTWALDGLANVRVAGLGGDRTGTGPTRLIWDGTSTTAAVTGYNADSIVFEDLVFLYSSGSFTGPLVDLDGDLAASTSQITIRGCTFTSATPPTIRSAARLLSLNGVHTVNIDSCRFGGADVLVEGKRGVTTDDFSNAVVFTNCFFAHADTAEIQNPGSAWSFTGCIFEACDDEPRAVRVTLAAGACRALSFTGCWFGDDSVAGDWIEWNGEGFAAAGNIVSVDNINTSFVKLTAQSYGVTITGTRTRGGGWLVDDTTVGTSEQVVVIGNHIELGVDIFKGGTVPDGALYHDYFGVLRVHGDNQFKIDGKLTTSDQIVLTGVAAGSAVLQSWASGASKANWQFQAGGTFWWGNGTDDVDTVLKRNGVAELYTTGDFRVGGKLIIDVPAGEAWFSTPAATTIGTAGVYVKAAGTTTLETTPAAVQFTMPSSNRLTYSGTETRKVKVTFTFSATTAGTNDLLGFALAKNGTVADKTIIQRYVSTGTDEGAGAIHGLFELDEDDYIEVFVTNVDATDTVTIERGNLTAVAYT